MASKINLLRLAPICLLAFGSAFSQPNDKDMPQKEIHKNPFMVASNVPVDYAKVTSKDVEDYSKTTINRINFMATAIKNQKATTFDNVFGAMDKIFNLNNTTSNNCFMLYWVSPDAEIRKKGLAGYQLLDSLNVMVNSDKGIYNKMISFKASPGYG